MKGPAQYYEWITTKGITIYIEKSRWTWCSMFPLVALPLRNTPLHVGPNFHPRRRHSRQSRHRHGCGHWEICQHGPATSVARRVHAFRCKLVHQLCSRTNIVCGTDRTRARDTLLLLQRPSMTFLLSLCAVLNHDFRWCYTDRSLFIRGWAQSILTFHFYALVLLPSRIAWLPGRGWQHGNIREVGILCTREPTGGLSRTFRQPLP